MSNTVDTVLYDLTEIVRNTIDASTGLTVWKLVAHGTEHGVIYTLYNSATDKEIYQGTKYDVWKYIQNAVRP